MKKLQIISTALLLFAIWLNTFPQGQNDFQITVSIISAFAGLICGAVSLFIKAKTNLG